MIDTLIQQFTEAASRNLVKQVEVYPREPQKGAIQIVFVTFYETTPAETRQALIEAIKTKYHCTVKLVSQHVILAFPDHT